MSVSPLAAASPGEGMGLFSPQKMAAGNSETWSPEKWKLRDREMLRKGSA